MMILRDGPGRFPAQELATGREKVWKAALDEDTVDDVFALHYTGKCFYQNVNVFRGLVTYVARTR